MITIYHNPRCSKSREGLEMLHSKGMQFTIDKYIDKGLTTDEIRELIKKLDIEPVGLVRQKETIWTEKYKGRVLSNDDIIDALHIYPQLIERPVVVNGDKAVIARPAEKMLTIL